MNIIVGYSYLWFADVQSGTGGLLGPMTREQLVPEFAEVAFEIEPSDCEKPIWREAKSQFGYHIIMVCGTATCIMNFSS